MFPLGDEGEALRALYDVHVAVGVKMADMCGCGEDEYKELSGRFVRGRLRQLLRDMESQETEDEKEA